MIPPLHNKFFHPLGYTTLLFDLFPLPLSSRYLRKAVHRVEGGLTSLFPLSCRQTASLGCESLAPNSIQDKRKIYF